MDKNFFEVSLNEVTRLFIVRHGRTDDSVEGRMSSRSRNISINEEGIEQIHSLGDRVKSYGISKIYASPLLRTHQTADILQTILDIDLEFDNRLMEYDFGVISDLTFAEVANAYPELHQELLVWLNAKADSENQRVRVPAAEPMEGLIDRISSFTKDIVSKHPGEKVLAVTHGGLIKAMMTTYAGGDIVTKYGRFMASTASMSVVDFYEGRPIVMSFNDTGHLGSSEVGFGRPLVL